MGAGHHDGVHCLLVHEPALARLLALSRQPSSPLPWLLRNAWDGQPLDLIRPLPVRHHVGLVAHVAVAAAAVVGVGAVLVIALGGGRF